MVIFRKASGPCTVDNKTRCKNRKLLQNEVNSKTGTVTSPKCLWILAPWGPQQVVEMRGISCRNHTGKFRQRNFESCYVQQTDSSVKKLHPLNLIENVKSNLTATRNEYLMLFSCATALLDKQERSLSTGIQQIGRAHV